MATSGCRVTREAKVDVQVTPRNTVCSAVCFGRELDLVGWMTAASLGEYVEDFRQYKRTH